MLKRCVDCFYHSVSNAPSVDPLLAHFCNHPDNADVVIGTPLPQNCYEMRRESGRCGRDPAKLFRQAAR